MMEKCCDYSARIGLLNPLLLYENGGSAIGLVVIRRAQTTIHLKLVNCLFRALACNTVDCSFVVSQPSKFLLQTHGPTLFLKVSLLPGVPGRGDAIKEQVVAAIFWFCAESRVSQNLHFHSLVGKVLELQMGMVTQILQERF